MRIFHKLHFSKTGSVFLKMVFHKAVLAALVLSFPAPMFSQSKTEEKANVAYQYKQYAQAAAMYETLVLERDQKNTSSKNTLNLKTKLAYCYRMNNKMEQAEALYAEIVQDDRAKSDTYFYYAETLMANGKYQEAKQWFKDYQILEPDDPRGALMAANCDKVALIEPYFHDVEITEYPFNSDADDNAPVAWQGGMVFSSDRKQGMRLMKEKSGWTGRDYLDLYFSELQEDGSLGAPRQFSAKLSEVNKNTGNASFSADGTEVYFTRNDNVLNKRETYNLQLFRAENNGSNRWKKAEKLSFCSPNYNFMHPALSPDGQSLFFATDRKGEGGTDLWVSHRKGDDWGSPENLGPTVNTSSNEGFPFMDSTGRLYFCSKGHPGYGGFDIFFTEMDESGQWLAPQNLGHPMNSPLDDISIFINENGEEGMFTSSRNGGDDDIYLFKVGGRAPVRDQFSGLIPRSEGSPEPFINEKPGAAPKRKQAAPPAKVAPVSEKIEKKPKAKPKAEDKPKADKDGEGIEEKTSSSSSLFFEMPSDNKDTTVEQPETAAPAVANYLFSFKDFIDRAYSHDITTGQIYRLDGAVFDPNIWQITPRVQKKLDDLVAVLRRFPDMKIELSAHTSTPGMESDNLELSKHRAEMAVEYMVKEGIAADRLKGVGYGEAMPLNRCVDGVNCSQEEHLYNQRFEVRVIAGIRE